MFGNIEPTPLLTQEELLSLYTKMKTASSYEKRRIKEKILTSNVRLCICEVRKYTGFGEDVMEDLLQDSIIELSRVIDRYDPEKHNMFSSYALPCIRNKLRSRVPVYTSASSNNHNKLREARKYYNYINDYRLEHGIYPSSETLEDMGWNKDKVVEFITLSPSLSLDQPYNDDEATLADCIEALSNVEDEYARTETSEKIIEVLDSLGERTSDILKRRFGFYPYAPHTYDEIGAVYSLSRERVRQIIATNLKKLRWSRELKAI